MTTPTFYNDTSKGGESYGNDSSEGFFPQYPDYTQLLPVHLSLIVLYIIVMFLSLVGNMMVVFTVWRHKKMHTVVNYYIVNLAISDLMVAGFVLPLKLLELAASPRWSILNDSLCNFLLYCQPIFVFASVLTLMATCIER